jgi:hypothetical protein
VDTWEGCEMVKVYKVDGKYHRVNGPAWYDEGSWGWYLFGVRHRYYGPQDHYWSGIIPVNWFIHGDMIK